MFTGASSPNLKSNRSVIFTLHFVNSVILFTSASGRRERRKLFRSPWVISSITTRVGWPLDTTPSRRTWETQVSFKNALVESHYASSDGQRHEAALPPDVGQARDLHLTGHLDRYHVLPTAQTSLLSTFVSEQNKILMIVCSRSFRSCLFLPHGGS